MNYRPLSKALAAELRAEVARQKLPLDDLVAQLPISKSTLQRRLSGESPINTDELEQLSRALKVDPSVLLLRASQAGKAAA